MRAVGAALLAALAAMHGHAGAVQAVASPSSFAVVDPDDIVADHSQLEWSEAYLQWIASFPRGSSPVSDATGALCDARQDGEVWFRDDKDGAVRVEIVPASHHRANPASAE